ncbi:MAG TPA: KH domain-containing protein [Abditibacteriaceae bacterium]|jgi:hypothetical protein
MSAEELENGANGAADSSDEYAQDDDIMAQAMGDDFDEPSEDDARLIELVGFLVQGIVAHPEEVEVEEFLDDVGSVYGVRVHPDDIGRVIGREGRVANALRHVVKAAATKTGARVAVEIITEDTPLEVIDSEDEAGSNGTEAGDGST